MFLVRSGLKKGRSDVAGEVWIEDMQGLTV